MDSYASQFQAIVGHNYTPSQELDGDQSRALTALIFSMPETEVLADEDTFEYHGWCFDQKVYLAVTVDRDHNHGAEAICASLGSLAE